MNITIDIYKIEPIKSIEEYLEFYSNSSTNNFQNHSKILTGFFIKYPENRITYYFNNYNLNPMENKALSELLYISLFAKKSVSMLAAVPTDEDNHNFDFAFLKFKKRCKNLFDYKLIVVKDKYWIKLNPLILNKLYLQFKIENQLYPIYLN